jgi:hypothetical protein
MRKSFIYKGYGQIASPTVQPFFPYGATFLPLRCNLSSPTVQPFFPYGATFPLRYTPSSLPVQPLIFEENAGFYRLISANSGEIFP